MLVSTGWWSRGSPPGPRKEEAENGRELCARVASAPAAPGTELTAPDTDPLSLPNQTAPNKGYKALCTCQLLDKVSY